MGNIAWIERVRVLSISAYDIPSYYIVGNIYLGINMISGEEVADYE